jgi:hypothetical protein
MTSRTKVNVDEFTSSDMSTIMFNRQHAAPQVSIMKPHSYCFLMNRQIDPMNIEKIMKPYITTIIE